MHSCQQSLSTIARISHTAQTGYVATLEMLLLAVAVDAGVDVICDGDCGAHTTCPTRMVMNVMVMECMIIATSLNGD